MPSIPQSLLWISLVVLWLFVLVPMLVSKRDNVRRTSDVALATRVLNSGRNARLRRPRASAGHNSDPHWQPAAEYEAEYADDPDDERDESRRRAVVLAAAVEEPAESPYLDVDVVDEDSGALPLGESFRAEQAGPQTEELTLDFDSPEPETAPQPVAETAEETVEEAAEEAAEAQEPITEDDLTEDDYEYVDDSSGLEAEAEDEPELAESMTSARRNRYESKTAQAVSARNLAYLRRQTRIEEQLRRRRAQRMMRSRLGVENTGDGEFDVVPARLRRPGAAVLEIDDEDPAFEHLEHARFAREYDLPRAAGQ
ncbi:MAG: rane protein [Mycobacterium sp.]|nr:rane protein [Mycobacterium sp.]